jgi:Protein of unknown function (DUF1071)
MTSLDLLKINVNDRTEKKNGMTYLSWAWAWTEVLKADPTATWKVELWADGTGMGQTVLMSIGDTAMVWVTVTMFGKPITCQLPVLDYRNKPIHMPNAMDVNTAIMRCMVKAVAMHGLGLYIYAGEDVPFEEATATMTVTTSTAQADVQISAPVVKAMPAMQDAGSNAELFAAGMIELLTFNDSDVKGLNSYWKANQVRLDGLKVSHPELYAQVRNAFAEKKKALQEKEKVNE